MKRARSASTERGTESALLLLKPLTERDKSAHVLIVGVLDHPEIGASA